MKLYSFFWAIPQCLNLCADVSEQCLLHLHRWCKLLKPPTKMDKTECSETLAHKFRHLGITQKKEYNIQNTVIVEIKRFH
jgi:hypothetical protein